VHATQLSVHGTVATCTGANCASLPLDGNTFVTEGRTLPFVVQVFGGANECIRLETTRQTTDLRIVVTAPDGVVYANDDAGSSSSVGCPLCSLVKLNTGTRKGYYTVQLAQWIGTPVESNFRVMYGRYRAGNANCNVPTMPKFNNKAAN
jgi:hypothetical protein